MCVNLVFVAGGRVLKYLGRSVAVEKALTTVSQVCILGRLSVFSISKNFCL